MKKSILRKIIYSIVAIVAFSCCLFSVPVKSANADARVGSRYYDAPGIALASDTYETISFARKEEEVIEFPYAVPTYYTTTLSNACGPVAGAIVVGYYDKYYEDLIPNYTAYYAANGRYRRPDSTYVPAVIQELYTSMQTNVVDVGVSVSECKAGLQDYVVSRDFSLTYTTIKSISSAFNETACKNAISNQKPVLLFCNSVTTYLFGSGTTEDELVYVTNSSSHVVVCYGYHKVQYYDANNVNFRTDTYLRVATGWLNNSTGYVKANDLSWVDEGYAVNIY